MEATNQRKSEIEILESCRINPLEEIEQPPVAISINSEKGPVSSFTLGNFSMVIGKAKSKKTFLIGAMVASAITGEEKLGMITGTLPENKRKVLYFDTEQSKYHSNRAINRIARIAGNNNPETLIAYALRKFNPDERLRLIQTAIFSTSDVGLVFIDGGRDLLSAINDEHQATKVTSDFLRWTEEKGIHLVVVLHQNKNDLHARGHFGSECVNKAETTLSVTESGTDRSVSIVSCEYSREQFFPDFAFRISEDGLPERFEIPQNSNSRIVLTNPEDITDSIHKEVLTDIFKENKHYSYLPLWTKIREQFAEKNKHFGVNKAKGYLKYYQEKGWINYRNRSYFMYEA